jgi:2-polyprenyl-6-methoxyphenol hydroxylase-like FAD-dependent oxidoreductase
MHTEVLIVGGGPVGLATALELSVQGVDCVLVDQTDGTVADPKVSTLSPRTMELCRRWGIAQRIRDAGWPVEHTRDVAWVTQVGGHEILRVSFPPYAQQTPPEYTPEPEQVCPQSWFQPIFLDAVRARLRHKVLLRHRLEGFEQVGNGGVRARVRALPDGGEHILEAHYLVACDGAGSSIRKQLNVKAPSIHSTREFQSILFRAPRLAEQMGERHAMVYFLVHPALREPLRAVDGRGLYRLIVNSQSNTSGSWDAEDAVRAALAFDTPFEVLSTSMWHLTHRVAERFRVDSVFLAGDAAHTLSPSGGFGMNTGIADAADLAWKLAAALRGWGGLAILDSYEAERRPIALRNLEQANLNLQRSLERTVPPFILEDSARGRAIRQDMAEGMRRAGVEREFDAPGVHLGHRYASALIVAAGDPPDPDPFAWQPTSYPGCRAPHAWVAERRSTLDLFGPGFTLLDFAGDYRGLHGLRQACAARGVPLRVVHVADPAVAALYECALVLVRPDGHVAWRGDAVPDEPLLLVDWVRGHIREQLRGHAHGCLHGHVGEVR